MAAELDFTLSLVDKLTKPLKQAQSAVTGFADKAAADFKRLGFGVAGLWGVAQGIKGLVNPARDMEAALAEVSSLDVANKTLDQLRKTSQNFAIDYGESASAFVRSAYDIQSAIAGLQGDELPKFTEASAILAKATKSDTATITNYMGTMYGVFKNTAEKMGRTQWVEQIAGQTASAVQMFKTTGNEMSAAFTALGANAQAMKVSAAEQFAVLGQLQSTMSGSEAGTKYKSFLAGIGNAQKVLGLNFTNQDGSAKGITDIIDLIKGKFGDLSKVSDADLLKKAFGSDEAVSMIKLLAGDVDGLKKNINSLGNVKGMDKAVEMAKKMVDPWDQVNSLLEQVRVSIGLRLDPVFAPFLQKIIDGGKAFMKWLDAFPNIARWIGYLSISMLGLAAAGAINNIVMGTFGFIATGLKPLIKGLGWAMNFKARYTDIAAKATVRYEKILKKLRGTLGGASMMFDVLSASELLALWPILAIGVAIAALVIAVIKFWQPIKAFFGGFIQGFSDAFESVGPLHDILGPVGTLFSFIGQQVKKLVSWFGDLLSPIQYSDDALKGVTDTGVSCGRFVAEAIGWILTPIKLAISWFNFLIDAIGICARAAGKIWDAFDASDITGSLKRIKGIFTDTFDKLWKALRANFAGVFNSIVGMLNKLPGVNIDLMDVAPTTAPTLTTGNRAAAIPGGPVSSQISNSKSEKIIRSDVKQDITLHVDTMPTPGQLAEYSELAAG